MEEYSKGKIHKSEPEPGNGKDVTNTGNGERGTGNGERGTGNGERGTGNGERGTGNGEPGTGVWERVYSGNSLENSKWRTKQKKRPQESTEETI